MSQKRVLAVVYDGMTFLDFNGPHTAFASALNPANNNESYYHVETVALPGIRKNIVTNEKVHVVSDHDFQSAVQCKYDVILIPGGPTEQVKPHADNPEFTNQLKALCAKSEMIFSICTGAGILARTGLLDGKEATSNKMAWDWVIAQGPNVKWIKERRWVLDGTLTAAGVSAGIDTGLFLVQLQYSRDVALQSKKIMEYNWNEDPTEYEW